MKEVIGKNSLWKQNTKLGKKNTQNFVNIPFNVLIEQITYKAEEKGIQVIITEESYTSKASFLDRDAIPVHNENSKEKPRFSGKRIKRGRIYQAGNGMLINADVNAAYNILRKVVPNAFSERDRGAVSVPQSLIVA